MPTVAWPEGAPDTWDSLRLGPHTFPGVWRVRGASERALDVKTRKGADGAKIKDQGVRNAPLTLDGTIANQADWEAVLPMIDAINPGKPGKALDPFQIVHPQAAFLNVSAVLIHKVHTPEWDGNGAMRLQIEVLEWRPEPKKVPKKVPRVTPASQAAANASVTVGRVLTNAAGQTFVDTGLRMPSSTALEALNEPSLYLGGS